MEIKMFSYHSWITPHCKLVSTTTRLEWCIGARRRDNIWKCCEGVMWSDEVGLGKFDFWATKFFPPMTKTEKM